MTLAERLRQEGYEEGLKEGLEKGILVGRIQATQMVLQQPEFPSEELYEKPKEELSVLLAELKQQDHESWG